MTWSKWKCCKWVERRAMGNGGMDADEDDNEDEKKNCEQKVW